MPRCLTLWWMFLPVGYAQTFNATVDRQDVGDVTVVEPEAGCVDEHSPVVGVAALEETVHLFFLKHKFTTLVGRSSE